MTVSQKKLERLLLECVEDNMKNEPIANNNETISGLACALISLWEITGEK